MKKKQSSLEWYIDETFKLSVKFERQEISQDEYTLGYSNLLQQAKAMHKEEIIKAAVQGFNFDAEGFPLEAGHHYGQLWYKNQFEGGNNE